MFICNKAYNNNVNTQQSLYKQIPNICTERNHPKGYNDNPCRRRQVLIIRIWLDFYEDKMSPWVLFSIYVHSTRINNI